MTEEWRAVTGFEGLYEVSSLGRVKSLRSGKMLTPNPQTGGYLRVTLTRDRRPFTRTVHRLVLTEFVGPRPPGKQARHRNGKKPENALSNLLYGTPKENSADRAAHGTTARGERQGLAKLSAAQVQELRERRAAGERGVDLAAAYGITKQNVTEIVRGNTWKHPCLSGFYPQPQHLEITDE